LRTDRPLIDAGDRDLAYVEIALVDADGNAHSNEDRAVTITVDGLGVLQGFGSGNPCTEETFWSPTHDTFNGRALAVVRPTGAGTISVTVSADGCEDRTVTIEAT
jgi:beta-galactosidase